MDQLDRNKTWSSNSLAPNTKLPLSVPPGRQTSSLRPSLHVSGPSKMPIVKSFNSCPSHIGPEDTSLENSQHTSGWSRGLMPKSWDCAQVTFNYPSYSVPPKMNYATECPFPSANPHPRQRICCGLQRGSVMWSRYPTPLLPNPTSTHTNALNHVRLQSIWAFPPKSTTLRVWNKRIHSFS